MSDENLIIESQTEDIVEGKGEENEGHHIEGEVKPPSKWEVSARDAGWVPLEEWQGDPEDWTDAKEFVKRGELFHKISNQSSEIKDLRKAISALTDHHQKVKETEFNRALEYLKQQKITALEEGDAKKLLAVDEAIDTLKEERAAEKEEVKQEVKAGPTPVFVDWVKSNPWYIKDPELRAFADDMGASIFNRNKGQISEQELYKTVRDRVLKAFPEKFKGQGVKKPDVEGSSSITRQPKVNSFKLTEDEEKVMKTFVRQGIMTKDEYITDLMKVKGVS